MTRKLKYIPIIGNQYRDWTVICDEIYKKPSNRNTYWKVQCKCGTIGLRSAQHLINNNVSSCKSCSKLKLSFEQSYFRRIKERADRMNFEFNITLDYILSLFNGKCSLSNEDIWFDKHWNKPSSQTASLDRIDNTKGYVIGNVQWVHKDINFMKGTLSSERFIELCEKVSSKCG